MSRQVCVQRSRLVSGQGSSVVKARQLSRLVSGQSSSVVKARRWSRLVSGQGSSLFIVLCSVHTHITTDELLLPYQSLLLSLSECQHESSVVALTCYARVAHASTTLSRCLQPSSHRCAVCEQHRLAMGSPTLSSVLVSKAVRAVQSKQLK